MKVGRCVLGPSAALLVACGSVPPPRSQFPSAVEALGRMKATYRCERGVHGEAAIDEFSDQGRIRGKVLLYVARPANLRFDVLSPPPFNSVVSTLTASQGEFRLSDLRERRFYLGSASPCNIARLTRVPVEPRALVQLLGGEAPLLVHEDSRLEMRWSPRGYYVVRIPSTRDAVEEVALAPTPVDRDKPWQEQRVRVVDVRVTQRGFDLYHAELGDHRWAVTMPVQIDPEGLEPPVAPSGPACVAEVPRRIHIEVPGADQDVLFRYDEVGLNPPLPVGVFSQERAPGLEAIDVVCP